MQRWGTYLGCVLGLIGVERRRRLGRFDGAEAAAARACVAHEHDGGGRGVAVATAPALADVGAARLLAHCVQLQLAQLRLDLSVLVTAGDAAFQPVRLPCLLLCILRVSAAAHAESRKQKRR